MTPEQYIEKCDPEKIQKWLYQHTSHEHLADIKKVSLDKYLAVAPDNYVMGAMLRAILSVAAEQKFYGLESMKEKPQVKPWNDLTEEEKISEAPLRQAWLEGNRAGRDSAMVELANRITCAAREELNRYRLENSEFDPDLVVDERDMPEVG